MVGWLIVKNRLIFTKNGKSGFSRELKINQIKKIFFANPFSTGIFFVFFLTVLPFSADAGVFSIFSGIPTEKIQKEESSKNLFLSATLLQATRSVNQDFGKGDGDITVIGGSALMPESGPVGTMADVEEGVLNETISTYIVRKGDNLQLIAKMFGVSVNTIVWANNIKNSVIKEGDNLLILPISGVQHVVKKGDTIESVAKKYKADTYDIIKFNNFSANQVLSVGEVILIPDGEISSPNTTITSNKVRGNNGPSYEGYYLKPILGGHKSQGLHGYNGIDLATYLGAPLFASAEGDVIVAAKGGWNGGYGKYIVIAHPNGTQTLYGHALDVLVSVGDHVVKGQMIGQVGSTGKSTGPHVHFEIRGAKNPF